MGQAELWQKTGLLEVSEVPIVLRACLNSLSSTIDRKDRFRSAHRPFSVGSGNQ